MAETNLAHILLEDEPQSTKNNVRTRPVLSVVPRRVALWTYRPFESRLMRRRIQLNEGFALFRVR